MKYGLILGVCAAAVAGCAAPDPNVVFGNTKGVVRLAEPPVVKTATTAAPMRVAVPLESKLSGTVNLQYHFEFFDLDGLPSHGSPNPPTWSFIQIAPHSQVTLTGNSADTDAVSWKLMLKKSDSSE